jgi:hypothetical protein
MLAMMLNVDHDIGNDVSNDIHDSDKISWTPHYAMCTTKKIVNMTCGMFIHLGRPSLN